MNLKQTIFFLVFILSFPAFSQDFPLETVIKKGHAGAVKSSCFSPDGKYIATGGRDKTAKIWEISTGREIRTFIGNKTSILCLCYSPDGNILVTGSGDAKIKLWNVSTGELIRTIELFTEMITSITYSYDGKYIIAGGCEDNGKIIDSNTGKLVREFKVDYTQKGVSLKVSKDNKFIFVGEDNRNVGVFEFETGKKLRDYKGIEGFCGNCGSLVDISPDGKYLLTANNNGPVQLIDLKTEKVVNTYIKEQDEYKAININFDATMLIVSGENDIQIFDLKSAKLIKNIAKAHEKEINSALFSPDGNSILTASNDGTSVIRKTKTGKIIQTFVGYLNTNDNGTKLDKEEYWEYYSRTYFDFKTLIKLSPDGKKLICGKKDSVAQVFDFESGRLLFNLNGHSQAVLCFDFSPNGAYIATGSTDNTIIIRNSETGLPLKTLKGHQNIIFSLNFRKDSKRLLSTSWDGDMIEWDVESGKIIKRINDVKAFDAKYIPNGNYVATAGLDNKLNLWESDSWLQFKNYVGPTNIVSSVDFSLDGKTLISGSWDGKARIWDVATGFQLSKIDENSAGVNVVLFSIDNKSVFTGNADGVIRMYNSSNGNLLKKYEGNTSGVTSIQLTPDGQTMASCTMEGIIKVWDINTSKEIYTLFPINRKERFMSTPGGFFDATDDAKKSVYFVKGLKTYGLDQFFEDFYRPGLLEQAIKSRGITNQYFNINDKLQKSPPPDVSFTIVKDSVFTKSFTLTFNVEDKGGGIDEIKILQNGKRLLFESKLSRKIKIGNSLEQSYEIELVQGENEITVSAFSKGRIESRPIRQSVFFECKDSYPNCYVLSIGINKYENESLTLNFAKSDAEGFSSVIKKNSESLFKNMIFYNLFDKEATKEKILTKIEEIAGIAKPEDVFIFYYAGHGAMLENDFYFIPVDCVRLYDIDELKVDAIQATVIQEKLCKIKALKQLLILDACQSGGSAEILGQRGATKEKAVAQLSRSTGIHVLASAGSEQFATEFKSLGHGLFTYVLIKALQGEADGIPQDGKITVYELKSFIDDQVPEYSKKLKGSRQYPYSFSGGNDFPIIYGIK